MIPGHTIGSSRLLERTIIKRRGARQLWTARHWQTFQFLKSEHERSSGVMKYVSSEKVEIRSKESTRKQGAMRVRGGGWVGEGMLEGWVGRLSGRVAARKSEVVNEQVSTSRQELESKKDED